MSHKFLYSSDSIEQINKVQQDQHLVWGWNSEGQLGKAVYNSDGIINTPTPIGSKSFNTADVAMGLSHTLILSSKGHVYSCGKGRYGRLGNASENSTRIPSQIHRGGVRVIKVAAGSFHSAFITETYSLFTFGRGDSGQLGLGDLENRYVPSLVTCKEVEGHVERVACGADHTILSLLNGCVYGMGANTTFQISGDLPSTEKLATPTFINLNPLLQPNQARSSDITSIAAGTGFTIISKNGEMYSWGNNEVGQCGIKNTMKGEDGKGVNDRIYTPTKINVVVSKTRKAKPVFTHVSAGIEHCIALTSDGEVFGWGGNKQGQIGQMFSNMIEVDTTTPLRIGESLMNEKVTTVACGSYHTIAVTSEGNVYGWGLNDYNQISTEKKANETVPVPLNLRIPLGADGSPIKHIAAGGRSSMALRFYPSSVTIRASTYKSDIEEIYRSKSCVDCELVLTSKQPVESVLSHKLFLSRSPLFTDLLDSGSNIINISKDQFINTKELEDYLHTLYSDYDDLSLPNHLFLYVNNPLYSDVKICVSTDVNSSEQKSATFSAHKCILVNRSLKLKHQLESNFQEGISNTIVINNSDPDTYLAFLHYLYTDRLNINADNAIDLLFLAHSENIDRMIDLVIEYLISGIDDDSVCVVYELSSSLGTKTKALTEQCVYYIAKNYQTVSQLESFKVLSAENKKRLSESINVGGSSSSEKDKPSCLIM